MVESTGFMCQTYHMKFMMICEKIAAILADIVLVGLLVASWVLICVKLEGTKKLRSYLGSLL